MWVSKASWELLPSPSLRWCCEEAWHLLWGFGERSDSSSWSVYSAGLWLVAWGRCEWWSCRPRPRLSGTQSTPHFDFNQEPGDPNLPNGRSGDCNIPPLRPDTRAYLKNRSLLCGSGARIDSSFRWSKASGRSVGREGCSFSFVSRPSRLDEGARQRLAVTSAVFVVIFFTQVKENASIFSSTLMILERRSLVASLVLVRLVSTYCLKGRPWLIISLSVGRC